MKIIIDNWMIRHMDSDWLDRTDPLREYIGIPIAAVWPEGLLWPKPVAKLEEVYIRPSYDEPFQGVLRIE